MPIRSPRKIYFLFGITKNLDNVPGAVDTASDEDFDDPRRLIFAKIKKGIGDYLGLNPVPWNSDVFDGTFQGEGLNMGYTYRRRIGGFKVDSYKLHAKTFFPIQEEFLNEDGDFLLTPTTPYRTMNIGMPKGVSVSEFINWVKQQDNADEIAYITTPKGHKINVDD